jgi:poly(A) polymerase
MTKRKIPITIPKRSRVADLLGSALMEKLAAVRTHLPGRLYLTGGTVRDILMRREPVDIDLTVEKKARMWARLLSSMTGSTLVPLGREEDAARVVWAGRDIDFSSFREGAESIGQELVKRDITVNSMAISLDELLGAGPSEYENRPVEIIDPAGGLRDIERRLIRVTSKGAFHSDPLRLLRIYRFAAVLDFSVDSTTSKLVAAQKAMISRVAAERVAHELDLTIGSIRAHAAVSLMARSGLLFEVLPELRAGVGMEQPASHHLDVFEHNLATLYWMLMVQQDPGRYFSEFGEVMKDFLTGRKRRIHLRWAALLHDLGKPVTVTIDEDRGGRITFYNHDREGARQVEEIARRLRWSGEDARTVARLVALHMRPFHLGNVQREGALSLKACLRLIRQAGGLLPGLFLLGMADALAGCGEGRPKNIEREIDLLFTRIERVRREHVEPVRRQPPLITGRDLIEELRLEPGPVFRELLERVEEARMEKSISTREEALAMVRAYLERTGKKNRPGPKERAGGESG